MEGLSWSSAGELATGLLAEADSDFAPERTRLKAGVLFLILACLPLSQFVTKKEIPRSRARRRATPLKLPAWLSVGAAWTGLFALRLVPGV